MNYSLTFKSDYGNTREDVGSHTEFFYLTPKIDLSD